MCFPSFPCRISAKDLKNMLSQVNYRVPNMRFLRERLTVSESPLSLLTQRTSAACSLPLSRARWWMEPTKCLNITEAFPGRDLKRCQVLLGAAPQSDGGQHLPFAPSCMLQAPAKGFVLVGSSVGGRAAGLVTASCITGAAAPLHYCGARSEGSAPGDHVHQH